MPSAPSWKPSSSLHEARDCFGDEEIEDGTEADLRQRLSEVTQEIDNLEHSPGG